MSFGPSQRRQRHRKNKRGAPHWSFPSAQDRRCRTMEGSQLWRRQRCFCPSSPWTTGARAEEPGRPKTTRSDVPSQPHSARFSVFTWTDREVLALMVRAEEKAGPEDVGEQALMRGLDTAFPFFRLGLSWSSVGRRSDDRPHNGFQEFPCRGSAFTPARLMSATIPLILVAMEGAVGRSSASHDSSGPQPPPTLCLSMCHELAIDRPNEGG